MNGSSKDSPRPRPAGRPRPEGSDGAGQRPQASTPPSFTPSGGARRPSVRGARTVGPGGATPSAPARRTPPRPSAASTPAPPEASGRAPAPHEAESARPAQRPPQYAPVRPSQPAGRTGAGVPPGGATGTPAAPPSQPRRRRRRTAAVVTVLVLGLVLLLAWPVGLLIWANGQIQHVEALSGAADTPGRVFLLAGSDSRADGGVVPDGTLGQRTDTIMLLTAPAQGTPSLVSLPRDTLVTVPGVGRAKLNSSFSAGGAPRLVETVEALTGLTVDHYVEIGMGGVKDVVDAVGGVELCLDYDVDDDFSGLVWEAGCHEADGTTALAFARMRYSDPTGDIGRTARQQQLIAAVTREVATPSLLLNPVRQVSLIGAATGALAVDPETGIVDLARLAQTFRAASGPEGFRGTPPIADANYRVAGVGSTVLLDDDADDFFSQVAGGSLVPSPVPETP